MQRYLQKVLIYYEMNILMKFLQWSIQQIQIIRYKFIVQLTQMNLEFSRNSIIIEGIFHTKFEEEESKKETKLYYPDDSLKR